MQVIGLGEHVDYWDGPQWSDRFSQRQFTRRQSDYTTAWGSGSSYTPQMVVDGAVGFVGSNGARALDEIRAAAGRSPARTVTLECSEQKPGTAELKIHVAPGAGSAGRLDVYAALVEDDLVTQVGGGENDGARLTHPAVARSLSMVGTATPARGFNGTASLPIGTGWKRPNLHAVVFAQDPISRRVLGVATAALP